LNSGYPTIENNTIPESSTKEVGTTLEKEPETESIDTVNEKKAKPAVLEDQNQELPFSSDREEIKPERRRGFSGIIKAVYQWEYFWLTLIVLATLGMHFSIITQVDQLILDEAHYVKDAQNIIANSEDLRPEHPPLGKLFIVGGIEALGDNVWGWRVPSILMGTLSVILFYLICRVLGMSRRASSIATFLIAFENFNFLMASVAMLDVFFFTLTLAFFLLYLYRQYILSGLFIGLAAVAKLYAAMGTPTIFIHWLFSKKQKHNWKFALTAILALFSFVAWMPIFDYLISGKWENPGPRIKEMLTLSGSLTFYNVDHPALSRPWEWVLSYRPMAFWYNPHYTGAVNLDVWVVTFPIVLYLLYRAIKGSEAGLFGFAWFFGMFVLWGPISILTNRVSFIFYYYPAIGALCLGLGLGLNEAIEWVRTKRTRIKVPVIAGLALFFLFHIASFVILSPVFIRS